MEQINQSRMIELALETAKKLKKKHLTRVEFLKETGIKKHNIYTFFRGGWAEICQKAGFEKPRSSRRIPEETLIKEFHRVAMEKGRIPTWAQLINRTKINADTIRKRFDGKMEFLKKYKEWLIVNEPDSGLLTLLEIKPGRNSTEYGGPVKFRGLLHAPTNELGVIYLFGMISQELGFMVEAMHTSYPDCEAKLCTDKKQDRWQKMIIEFEYRSRNFLNHCHDISKCDMIVCWENNWDDCPIKVLELKTEIERMRNLNRD